MELTDKGSLFRMGFKFDDGYNLVIQTFLNN